MAKRDIRATEYHLFQTGDAAEMIGVDRRTLSRWVKQEVAIYVVDEISSWRLFSLEEVNRLRRMRRLPPLTEEEAIKVYIDRH